MMSLTTYALVLVPCLVGGAAVLGVTSLRRSAARLDRRGVCLSTGSACHAGSRKPSHVLTALDPGAPTRDGLRISLSRFTTEAELERFVEILVEETRA